MAACGNFFIALLMTLASLTANGDFSQSSLSVFGYPEAKLCLVISGWRCCSSSEVETEERVQQPPKIRKTFGGPQGKIDLSGKLARVINKT